MLERGVFLPALVGVVQRLVERLLEAAGEGVAHGVDLTSFP